jgi:ABC-type dipeptide/oligopeptide/nickel transport system permease component
MSILSFCTVDIFLLSTTTHITVPTFLLGLKSWEPDSSLTETNISEVLNNSIIRVMRLHGTKSEKMVITIN